MRADAESSCTESCTDCWHHWFGSLCGQAARRTSRSSCCATNSLCCADKSTDRSSPTPTGGLLGAIAAALPRPSRAGWLVTPDTLLRWHRRRIVGHWTLWVPETRPWWLTCRDAGRRVGAGNSAVVIVLPRWGPMLSPRVPNLVPIPGPRMERETPGQRPRPNYGHPHPHRRLAGSRSAIGSRTVVVVLAGTRHRRSARPPLCAPEQPEAQPSPSSPPRRQPIGDWF